MIENRGTVGFLMGVMAASAGFYAFTYKKKVRALAMTQFGMRMLKYCEEFVLIDAGAWEDHIEKVLGDTKHPLIPENSELLLDTIWERAFPRCRWPPDEKWRLLVGEEAGTWNEIVAMFKMVLMPVEDGEDLLDVGTVMDRLHRLFQKENENGKGKPD